MRTILPAIALLILLAACGNADNRQNKPRTQTTGSAAGLVVGSTFDSKPLTIGQGDLQGKALVVTYFATW